MSEEAYEILAARRRQVRRRQKRIRNTLITIILMLIGCCAVLLIRIRELNQRLEDLTAQLENATQISAEPLKEQWMEENAAQESEAVTAEQEEAAGQQETAAGSAEPDALATGASQEAFQEPWAQGSEPGAEEASQEAFQEPETQAAHKVYLTFDDGPGAYTEDILGILEKYNVKATFFVVGKEGESAEKAMCDIVDGGHTIGMHSYSHRYSEIYQSVEAFAADFKRLQDYIYDVTGEKSTVYRFPGGSSNTISKVDMQEFADYLKTQDVEFYDWNISSGDGGSAVLDVETLVKNCTTDIKKHGTSIILMHDKSTTVDALPVIIENILAMEDTVILPITEDTEPVHHITTNTKE